VLEATSKIESNEPQGGQEKEHVSRGSSNQVESNSNEGKNIVCTPMQNEVNLSSLHPKEGKEMTNLFKIQVKKTKLGDLFDFGSKPTS